jgi:hypothetical protein
MKEHLKAFLNLTVVWLTYMLYVYYIKIWLLFCSTCRSCIAKYGFLEQYKLINLCMPLLLLESKGKVEQYYVLGYNAM